MSYGFSADADVRATDVEMNAEGAAFTAGGVRFRTVLTGRHSISNILAGLAVASVFDIKFADLVQAVAGLAPGEMRGERTQWRGVTVLNDSYNSNPEAARSMIDVLREEPAKRRIAVLGEMLELGGMSEALHREIGHYVASAGVDVLVGVRGVSRSMVEEAAKSGSSHHAAFFFQEPEALGDFLRDLSGRAMPSCSKGRAERMSKEHSPEWKHRRCFIGFCFKFFTSTFPLFACSDTSRRASLWRV